ncbi:TetR family transcriptional regulator [Coralloluteibacterium thermophilus]|uniref:TetR family transcriptional regulator n=1 Tax=Coralloluteibacterium thermophilum TaxID=2707049 RepID=A0ABV9NLE1_9GAMM
MARRTKEDAAQTREAILDAAVQVFHEKGVSRSSLEEIARRAGVTRGAVYWHFAHKRDVLQAMGMRVDALLGDRRERMLREAESDPMAAMRSFLHFLTGDLLEDDHVRTILDVFFHRCEYVDEMREFKEFVDDEKASRHREMVSIFERARAQGQVRQDMTAEDCAVMTKTMLEGILRTTLLDVWPCGLRGTTMSNARRIDFLLESLGYRIPPAA